MLAARPHPRIREAITTARRMGGTRCASKAGWDESFHLFASRTPNAAPFGRRAGCAGPLGRRAAIA